MTLLVDIEKKIGNFHLKAAFTMNHRENFGLLGESGCGKSMTLKCIAGIMTPDKGKIILNDRVLYDSEKKINLSPQKRKVGYLFQDYALFPNMNVEQNIAVVLKNKNRAKEYLEQFYLKGLEKHYPSMLSGGQRQRCAIARMMAAEPELLLFDEPFSAVDKSLRWNLELQILDILDKIKKPVILVSHDRDEIYHLCDRVGILEWGQMRDMGTKEEVFSHPKTVAAARMTGCENIFPIQGKPYAYIGIPSHAMKLASDKSKSQIKGQVIKILKESHEKIVIVQLKDQTLYVRMGKEEGENIRIGQEIKIALDTSQIWKLNIEH